jgi:hypothetical protein
LFNSIEEKQKRRFCFLFWKVTYLKLVDRLHEQYGSYLE